MSVKKLAIKELKLAKFNPQSRQADVRILCQSIERVGLLYPVLITKQHEVVDGHRRVAACKKLGWTDIPTLVAEGSQAEMFAEINSSARPVSGNQTLQVYLAEPLAVGAKVRSRLEDFESTVGRNILERMAKEGFTLGTWYTAKKIAKAADVDDNSMLLKILRWLMKYRCARVAERALTFGTAPSKIMAAIKNDKPIRVSYVS